MRTKLAQSINSKRTLLARMSLAASIVLVGFDIAGCKTEEPPTPLSQLDAQQVLGHQYFATHCGQCHYDREPGPLHGPSLLGIFKKPYLPSGSPANNERVTETILHGHKLMPASPDTDPSDLDDLLAYLHTL